MAMILVLLCCFISYKGRCLISNPSGTPLRLSLLIVERRLNSYRAVLRPFYGTLSLPLESRETCFHSRFIMVNDPSEKKEIKGHLDTDIYQARAKSYSKHLASPPTR